MDHRRGPAASVSTLPPPPPRAHRTLLLLRERGGGRLLFEDHSMGSGDSGAPDARRVLGEEETLKRDAGKGVAPDGRWLDTSR